RDREAEPHVHPRRVGAYRPVDCLLEPGERDDLVELLAQVRALEPVDRAVEENVLAPGQVGMEAGAELEQRADAAADVHASRRRLDDPRDQPQESRLPGSVPADEPDRAAGLDLERNVLQRHDVARTRAVARDDRVLQPSRLARVDLEDARRTLD